MSDQVYAKTQIQQKTLIGASPKNNLLQSTCTQNHSSNSVADSALHFGHDFSQIPVYSSHPPMLQAKLTVNQPGDVYEQEADRVATQVMRMTDSGPAVSNDENGTKTSFMRKQSNEPQADTGTAIANVPPEVHSVLSSGSGRPLDTTTRAFMEPRFGHDFSRVRVHTNSDAADAARAIQARAYTVGRNIVFAPGEYSPESGRGRTLLAHELTHVVQQGFGTRQQAVQMKKNDPEEKTVADPLEATQKEALAAVGAIESNWKTLAKVAAPYDLLKPWIAHGDAVVALIRAHTTASLEAMRAKDSELASAYTLAVGTDKITYDYIAWHVTAYVNLLSLRSGVNELVDSFDHDKREFTGRANAERLARQLKKASDGLKADSGDELALVRRDVPLVVHARTKREVTITVTSPAIDPKVRTVFEQHTERARKLQVSIQQSADIINQFVDGAFEEGLEQAAEALKEYYNVRKMLSGPKGGDKPKQEKQTKQETKPDVQPIPLLPPDEEKRRKKSFVMRFQVQWNSKGGGPTFSQVATAPADPGVTTGQAITALNAAVASVTPDAAKEAAEPAAAKQRKWILSRPPGGIDKGGYSQSEYFVYKRYTDARVDVENLVGHNLRKH
ncbi:MAG TPA: DUF4157 domain-containing protein [Ktedonobacteraceae bacterium]|nr:DUF4157 domain-containing protein [Ktedonobacteraceae bacterium]